MQRRFFLVTPLALLSSACALRPWTPSTSVAFWSEETPRGRLAMQPSEADVVGRWQLGPQSPWARYQKLTLFAALRAEPQPVVDVRELEVVRRAEASAQAVAAAGVPQDVLWLVDLRGAASVAFGAVLSRGGRVALVTTFNNWPAEDGLVPAEEALSALMVYTPQQSSEAGASPVFLLDAWRLAYRFDVPDDDVTDNRYVMVPGDLPDAATLLARGIRRVLYVVEDLDETDQEEDDLHGVLHAWELAGLSLHMVDLSGLARPLAPGRWGEVYESSHFEVRARSTLLDDPVFYGRARGGFGGLHGGGFGSSSGSRSG
ncbi:MAG: hypothetical protein WCI05_05490 [Myxococcales bacterium]